MRILLAHNRYRFAGGEDTAVRNEAAMLRSAGHEVRLLEADNRTIEGPLAQIAAAGSLFASRRSRLTLQAVAQEFRPDLLHVHNWFPLLSPSVHKAAARLQIPVVQTLHNFRMLCANSALFRDGHICHDCIGKAFPLKPALHACYSGSHIGSAVVSTGFAYHRWAGSWNAVSRFIALSPFQRDLLLRGGLDASRTVIKPNFVPDRGVGTGHGGYILFVGRLTAEKGIRTVLRAWQDHPSLPPLHILGDGPLASEVQACAANHANVTYLGQQPPACVAEQMQNALALVFASECYEALPLTVLESFAAGTPVVAAGLPSVTALVREGETGSLFAPGDTTDLAEKIAAFAASTAATAAMRASCRREYEQNYSEQSNYAQLMQIYAAAIRHSRVPAGAPEHRVVKRYAKPIQGVEGE